MKHTYVWIFTIALLLTLGAPALAVDGCCQLDGECKQAPDEPIHQNKCAFHGGVWNAPGICQANGQCLWASGSLTADEPADPVVLATVADATCTNSAPAVPSEDAAESGDSAAPNE